MTNYSNTEVAQLKALVAKGVQSLQEIDDIKNDLKEQVDNLSEELDIRIPILNRAIRLAHKSEIERKRMELNDVEDILAATGHI